MVIYEAAFKQFAQFKEEITQKLPEQNYLEKGRLHKIINDCLKDQPEEAERLCDDLNIGQNESFQVSVDKITGEIKNLLNNSEITGGRDLQIEKNIYFIWFLTAAVLLLVWLRRAAKKKELDTPKNKHMAEETRKRDAANKESTPLDKPIPSESEALTLAIVLSSEKSIDVSENETLSFEKMINLLNESSYYGCFNKNGIQMPHGLTPYKVMGPTEHESSRNIFILIKFEGDSNITEIRGKKPLSDYLGKINKFEVTHVHFLDRVDTLKAFQYA